jgi:Fe-S cluster assembly ATP-binding protein
LHVAVAGKEILHGVNLRVRSGEVAVLFGPNGVGKSSLFLTIMGFPRYQVLQGRILFRGQDIAALPIVQRARLGIGMSFQRPPTIRGVTLSQLGSLIQPVQENGQRLKELASLLRLEPFLERDIHLGFSGGEIKRAEIFQLLLQHPALSLVDEPESGVDVENISLLGEALKKVFQRDEHLHRRQNCGLIITHTGLILNYLNADRGYVLIDGRISCHGNAREIFDMIQEQGYHKCLSCFREK